MCAHSVTDSCRYSSVLCVLVTVSDLAVTAVIEAFLSDIGCMCNDLGVPAVNQTPIYLLACISK